MQGGDPKWCWCMYFRTRGLSWSNSTAKQNREGLRSLAGNEPAPGLVAYRDGEAVGWIGMSPRETYERLESSKVLARVDDKPVWSIVCFVVGAKSRGQGVAAALLKGAIEYARSHGADDARGVSGGDVTRQGPVRRRFSRLAVDVREGRFRPCRRSPVEQELARAADHAPGAVVMTVLRISPR